MLKPNSKEARLSAGFTYDNHYKDVLIWFNDANAYNVAAEILHKKHDKNPNLLRPFCYNAAVSIELLMKAILIKKGHSKKEHHQLLLLAQSAEIKFTKNEILTLELLTEIIYWVGRYPTPTDEERWDTFHNEIIEKHLIREVIDEMGSTLAKANLSTWPTLENYQRIWNKCLSKYNES